MAIARGIIGGSKGKKKEKKKERRKGSYQPVAEMLAAAQKMWTRGLGREELPGD